MMQYLDFAGAVLLFLLLLVLELKYPVRNHGGETEE